jgi:hypothetical protein
MEGEIGTQGTGQGSKPALQTTRLFYLRAMGEREAGFPYRKLFCWFPGFCWMGGRVGGGVFTRCIIGVYYRCVYCGKECRFLLG